MIYILYGKTSLILYKYIILSRKSQYFIIFLGKTINGIYFGFEPETKEKVIKTICECYKTERITTKQYYFSTGKIMVPLKIFWMIAE